MDTRPKPQETEEDILRQQREFLKNKVKPSVTVIKSDLASKISNVCDSENQITEQKQQTSVNLIGSIIERHAGEPNKIDFPKFASGFPQAKRRETSSTVKKGSIFSQQSKKFKSEKYLENSESDTKINIPRCSYILSGKDSDNIHNENVKTLSKMSEQEIINEQAKLLQNLNPEIVKFLKSKRKNTIETKVDDAMDIATIQESLVDIDQLESAKEIIEQSDKWLHFDKIETEKLQWMKSIDIPKQFNKNETYEARFDFSGWLLPYAESEISEKNRILYHHGEEPGRPGYSLKELFQLCRSSVQQQKILALNTISQILSLYSTGVYDNVIDLPLEQIFFVIRISLDDNTPTVLNASMKTMHHLFYSPIDEISLDALLGFGLGKIQPKMQVVTKDQTRDDKEINDQELAELDLVECLARTDILIRIRYIINVVQPNTETIIFCIELLIRLVRDSDKILTKVYNCEDLFKIIIKNFIPKIYKLENSSVNCYGKPLIQAIKLLRVAACRRKLIAEDLIKKYNVISFLISYVSNNITENIIGIKLQTETFKLLAVFYHYKLGLEYYSDLQGFLLSAVNYHLQNTNIDRKSSYVIQSHFSSLMNIVKEYSSINFNLTTDFIPLLMQCLLKYCNQISNLIDFECGKLQVLSSLLSTITAIMNFSSIRSDKSVEKVILSLLQSSGFKKITDNISIGSNLLCEYETHKLAPNLNSLESAMWMNSDHILPCLNTKSCIPFLTTLSGFICNTDNETMILTLLRHENISKYLVALNNCSKFNLTSNWFTKIESELLLNILKSSIKVQKLLGINLSVYYALTVKCLSIFTIDQSTDIDFVLKNIVFNKQFYPSEILLDQLTIDNNKEIIRNILTNLEEIYLTYSDVLNLKKEIYFSSLTIDLNIGNIIPVDWIFTPIIVLYAKNDETKKNLDENQKISIISKCLQWIFFYESYFSELCLLMNFTDIFCRLSCIFLCSNTLFLEKSIQLYLELCLKFLIRSENLKKLNFDSEIKGLTNFQDFYIELLEQYQGVSYGDKLFANFVIIPLTQNHNSKWKKIVWSEYLGVAQTINLDLNECFINLEEFLNPPETDISILKCYRRALVNNQLNRSPLLKYIANYHVEAYVKHKRSS